MWPLHACGLGELDSAFALLVSVCLCVCLFVCLSHVCLFVRLSEAGRHHHMCALCGFAHCIQLQAKLLYELFALVHSLGEGCGIC